MKQQNLPILTVTVTDDNNEPHTALCILLHDVYIIKNPDGIYVHNKYTDRIIATLNDITLWEPICEKYSHEV